MKGTIKILLYITIIVASFPANSQQLAFHDFENIAAPRFFITKSIEKKFERYPLATQLPPREYLNTIKQAIPEDTYTRNFGFFCKEELQLQKRFGVNFSLRLGTLEYCNFLEGKNRVLSSR